MMLTGHVQCSDSARIFGKRTVLATGWLLLSCYLLGVTAPANRAASAAADLPAAPASSPAAASPAASSPAA